MTCNYRDTETKNDRTDNLPLYDTILYLTAMSVENQLKDRLPAATGNMTQFNELESVHRNVMKVPVGA